MEWVWGFTSVRMSEIISISIKFYRDNLDFFGPTFICGANAVYLDLSSFRVLLHLVCSLIYINTSFFFLLFSLYYSKYLVIVPTRGP